VEHAFELGQRLYARNSISFSPCSKRFTASGHSGSSHASNARFEQFPFPNPDQLNGLVTQEPAIHEVLVLADDDGLLGSCASPNHRIISSMESEIKDMRSLMTLPGNPTG